MASSETNDRKTFYWYFKPIAVLCKLIGIFPIQNVIIASDPKDLRFKFFSLANFYSLCVFGCIIFMIQYFSGFIFNHNKDTNCFYSVVVVYVIIARSVFCLLYCGRLGRKLPYFIRLLHAFDKRKTPVLIEKKKDGLVISLILWTILPVVIGFSCFTLSFLESMRLVYEIMPPSLNPTYSKVSSMFFGALSIWQVVPLLLYIYFALKIKYNFDIINRTLRQRGCTEAIFNAEPVKFDDNMHTTIGYLRFMHNILSKSVHQLGKSYGNFMAIDQLCVIVMIVVNICTFINAKTIGNDKVHLLGFTFLNAFVVVTVLIVSNRIKETGSKAIELLQGIQFSNVNERCRLEIQTFMIQIAVRPVEVSASGYFTIDKRQIPSMLSSIATYLVASLQFLDQMQSSQTAATMPNGTIIT